MLTDNFQLSGLADVLIIALLIYSLLLFFRRTRSYLLFVGLAIIFALYFLAKFLQLRLTLLTFQYFFGVSVFALITLFRPEIRKYFEVLGLVGSRQIKGSPLVPKSPTTREIVQACVQMAKEKIGALIVLQGRDDVIPFVEGGVSLEGAISEEVILSIFDPHSEGHDGAVIVINNRIHSFGAHLPLSTNFKEIGKKGTRHSAALGLSEECDALSVVVSEEKGKISVCKDGRLKTLAEFADLEKELENFVKKKFASPSGNVFTHALTHNFWLKIGALAAAEVVWFISAFL